MIANLIEEINQSCPFNDNGLFYLPKINETHYTMSTPLNDDDIVIIWDYVFDEHKESPKMMSWLESVLKKLETKMLKDEYTLNENISRDWSGHGIYYGFILFNKRV